MAVYRICDRWDVALGAKDEEVEKEPTAYGEASSMLEFLSKYPKQVARNQWCFWYLINQIDGHPTNVVHYCAGAGFNATICENLLEPTSQTLLDIDMDCIKLLKKHWPRSYVESFYDSAGHYPADIGVLDVNDCTAVKLTRNEKFLNALRGVLSTSYVTMIADIAITHLPVNRKVYSKALGQDVVTIDDYILALSKWLHSRTGACIEMTAGHHGTTWIMLTKSQWHHPCPHVKAPPEADKFFYRVA